jgi:hypothetical protein
MSIATQQSPATESARAGWKTIRRVALFDAHPPIPKVVRTPDGRTEKLAVGCSEDDLQEMAENSNARVARGAPPVLQIGHTRFDDLPEQDLPKVVGRAVNFTVGDLDGTPCLFADLNVLAAHYEDASTYPWLSIERIGWDVPGKQSVRGIALLRREPERDLPAVAYGRERTLCYERERPMLMTRSSSINFPADPALRRRIVAIAVGMNLSAAEALAEYERVRHVNYSRERPKTVNPDSYLSDPVKREKVRDYATRRDMKVADAVAEMTTKGLI